MKQLHNISPLSTERLAKMSSEEFAESAHLINNVIEDVSIENLYFVPFREQICKYLETIFVSEDFRFTIDIDENSHIYGQITSSYDKQRRERRADKQPIADRRYMFGSNSSLETNLCKAFVAYKKEVKYYNKHNNKQNKNNITVMKKDSKKQVSLAVPNTNESVVTFLVEGLVKVSALPAGMSVNVSDWMQNVTNGRLVSTTDNGVITVSVRKGVVMIITIADLADEDCREYVKVEFCRILDNADRMSSRETKSTPVKEKTQIKEDKKSSSKTEVTSMTEEEIKRFNEYFCSEEGQKILNDKLEEIDDDCNLQSLASKMSHGLKKMSQQLNISVLTRMKDYVSVMTADSKKLYDDYLDLAK